MDINGWYVKDNAFIKGFMDYVVKIEQYRIERRDYYKEGVAVTVWKGEGHENTKHIVTYDSFEDAFKFVDEFSKQKFFDQVVEEYFKDERF